MTGGSEPSFSTVIPFLVLFFALSLLVIAPTVASFNYFSGAPDVSTDALTKLSWSNLSPRQTIFYWFIRDTHSLLCCLLSFHGLLRVEKHHCLGWNLSNQTQRQQPGAIYGFWLAVTTIPSAMRIVAFRAHLEKWNDHTTFLSLIPRKLLEMKALSASCAPPETMENEMVGNPGVDMITSVGRAFCLLKLIGYLNGQRKQSSISTRFPKPWNVRRVGSSSAASARTLGSSWRKKAIRRVRSPVPSSYVSMPEFNLKIPQKTIREKNTPEYQYHGPAFLVPTWILKLFVSIDVQPLILTWYLTKHANLATRLAFGAPMLLWSQI